MKVAGSKTSIPPSMDPLDEASGAPGGFIPFEWITTTMTGDRFGTKADGTKFEEKSVMLYSARDPVTDEVSRSNLCPLVSMFSIHVDHDILVGPFLVKLNYMLFVVVKIHYI